MDWGELFRAAVASIRAHALRSFLTLLGIIIGVTTIVGVASIIAGLNEFVQEKIIRLAPDVYGVDKFGVITSREEFLDAIRRPDLGDREIRTLERTLTLADVVAANVNNRGPVTFRDRRLGNVVVNGSTYNLPPLVALEIAAGRFFTDAEGQAGAAVAVIGWDVKEELYGTLDPLGRDIAIAGVPHHIVGVMEAQGRMLGQSQDQQVYVPMRAWRKLYGNRSTITILIKAKGGVLGLDASMDETRAVLRALRHASFKDPDPFGMFTYESLQTLWRQVSAAAFILSMLVSSVSLGVGGVVIMNIMLVGVVERTREIGVRMALGARKRDIRRQFLLEAALLSTAGGVIGLVIGAVAATAVRGFLSFPAKTTPAIIISSLLLSTMVGLAAGYWPARGASNLPVVDALRDET